jgi:hypothetical protein
MVVAETVTCTGLVLLVVVLTGVEQVLLGTLKVATMLINIVRMLRQDAADPLVTILPDVEQMVEMVWLLFTNLDRCQHLM